MTAKPVTTAATPGEAEEVLRFWLEELEPADWYKQDDKIDATIRDRFEKYWKRAKDGQLGHWLTDRTGALAYLLVVDQFSRNIFRNDPRSFKLDHQARAAAKLAIDNGWDMQIDPPARQFFYLPLMHSENIVDQDRAVRLVCERLPEAKETLIHSRAHRKVIRQFGRFPHRNETLGRQTTEAERAFLAEGGYSAVVRQLKSESAA